MEDTNNICPNGHTVEAGKSVCVRCNAVIASPIAPTAEATATEENPTMENQDEAQTPEPASEPTSEPTPATPEAEPATGDAPSEAQSTEPQPEPQA